MKLSMLSYLLADAIGLAQGRQTEPTPANKRAADIVMKRRAMSALREPEGFEGVYTRQRRRQEDRLMRKELKTLRKREQGKYLPGGMSAVR